MGKSILEEVLVMFKITEKMRVEDKFPSIAWPGMYPLFYFAESTGQTFCPDCANQKDAEPEVTHVDINYENEDMYCDGCGNKIESAYGD